MAEIHYVAQLAAEADGGYSVTFAGAPGAITQGDTLEEALANARDAIETWLEAAIEAGETPQGFAGDVLIDQMLEAAQQNLLPALIAAETPGRAVRVNVSMDETLLARIDRVAEAAGQSRSGFLAEAARRALRQA